MDEEILDKVEAMIQVLQNIIDIGTMNHTEQIWQMSKSASKEY